MRLVPRHILRFVMNFDKEYRGMRVTVGMVVGQIGAGHSVDEILSDYPYLEREVMLVTA